MYHGVRSQRLAAGLLVASSTLVLGALAPAHAQDEGDFALEEIVVTAQKRAEKLSDVPVSVAAVTANAIQQAGIKKMDDLQFKVPNFVMTETGIGTRLAIRGISSGENQGFEQSVGLYIDGIHYGRAQQSRAPFLDLERVEVLRGPQSILFGKNAIAGALNITTAQPTSEFEGYVQASYEPKYNEFETTGVVSGPLSDKVRFRVAGRYHETDGYMKNATLDKPDAERDDWQLRGMLAFDMTDDFTVTLKAEAGKFNVDGRETEVIQNLPSTSTSPLFAGLTYAEILTGAANPRIAGINAATGMQLLPLPVADASVANVVQDGIRSSNGENSHNNSQTYVLNANYNTDAGTFTAISGYSRFKYDELCDCDFTGADVFNATLAEEYTQFSQELRFVSEKGGAIDYILGGFFQTSKDTYSDQIRVDANSVLVPLVYNQQYAPAYQAAATAWAAAPSDVNGDSVINALDAVAAGHIAGATAGASGLAVANTRARRNAEVEADVWSLFGQMTWNMTDETRMTFGSRVNYEKKSGDRTMVIEALDGSALSGMSALLAPIVYANGFHITSENLNALAAGAPVPAIQAAATGLRAQLGTLPTAGEISKWRYTPSLNLQHDAGDTMLYGSWVMGAKSGGFDYRANNMGSASTMADAFEFGDEKAMTWEAGLKSRLLGGRAELNMAAYYTDFKDLQVSIYDGVLGFNVGNAAEARIYGFELDGRIALTESLTASGSFSWTDFKFKEFLNGQCYPGQTTGVTDAAHGLCDYSGKTNSFIAKTSGTLALDYVREIADNLTVAASADMFYTGKYFATPTLDPMLVQGAYAKLNARLAIGAADGGWELALLGKNLTDKKVLAYGATSPLGATTFNAYSNFAMFAQGRTFVVQGKVKF